MIESISQNTNAGPDLKKTKRQKQSSDTHNLDRLPPHSPEAERGVLGCCLLSPKDCIGDCVTRFKDMNVFYDLRHETIYNSLVAMWNEQPSGIDIITLQQRLKDNGYLEQIGGIPYLSQIQDAIPSAANLSFYADIVFEKHLLRRAISVCTEVVARVYDFEGDVYELIDTVEKDVLALTNAEDGTAQKPAVLMTAVINEIEQQVLNPQAVTGLATGFADLDSMTRGLQPKEMIVIAARPSMGKTALAMNIVEHVAIKQQLPTAVFSLEMGSESLIKRMMCSMARVNLRLLNHGILPDDAWPKLTNAAQKLNNAPLWIDDTAGLSILQLRARARRLSQQHGIKLFVIDYLQLLHSTARKAQDNRQIEISDISGGVKALAKELKVPVIVLSQLNREMERDKGRKPRLSDLRESGAIEQDADLVGLLYKAGDDEPDTQEQADAQQINLLIAKQRNGPCGDVNLTFLKPYTRFESMAYAPDEQTAATLPYHDD